VLSATVHFNCCPIFGTAQPGLRFMCYAEHCTRRGTFYFQFMCYAEHCAIPEHCTNAVVLFVSSFQFMCYAEHCAIPEHCTNAVVLFISSFQFMCYAEHCAIPEHCTNAVVLSIPSFYCASGTVLGPIPFMQMGAFLPSRANLFIASIPRRWLLITQVSLLGTNYLVAVVLGKKFLSWPQLYRLLVFF